MIQQFATLALLSLLLTNLPAGAQAAATHQHAVPPTPAAAGAMPFWTK